MVISQNSFATFHIRIECGIICLHQVKCSNDKFVNGVSLLVNVARLRVCLNGSLEFPVHHTSVHGLARFWHISYYH